MWLVARILYAYQKLLQWTCTFEHVGFDNYLKAKATSPWDSCVIALWHGNIACSLFNGPQVKTCTLINPSRDGDLAAYLAKKWAFNIIRGNKRKANWLNPLCEKIKQGINFAITVDGSRGPIYRCKPGALLLAQKMGIPIVPYNAVATKRIVFKKAWDHHQIPLPFSKITHYWGEAMWVPETATREDFPELQEELEQRIHGLLN